MRPASEVAKRVYAARFWSDADAAAIIEADRKQVREEVVREVCEWLTEERADASFWWALVEGIKLKFLEEKA